MLQNMRIWRGSGPASKCKPGKRITSVVQQRPRAYSCGRGRCGWGQPACAELSVLLQLGAGCSFAHTYCCSPILRRIIGTNKKNMCHLFTSPIQFLIEIETNSTAWVGIGYNSREQNTSTKL